MKFGITSIGRSTSKWAYVSVRKLSDTAVTASDDSIAKAITGAKAGSLPTSVMSVPCKVVMNGTRTPRARRISRATKAADACGMA